MPKRCQRIQRAPREVNHDAFRWRFPYWVHLFGLHPHLLYQLLWLSEIGGRVKDTFRTLQA
jgi:hypothetical protein